MSDREIERGPVLYMNISPFSSVEGILSQCQWLQPGRPTAASLALKDDPARADREISIGI